MQNQSEYAIRERGGVPLHDYTQSGLPAALSSRFSISKLLRGRKSTNGDGMSSGRSFDSESSSRSGWGKINFDMVGRSLIFASLGFGMMQLLMPRRMLKMAGVRDKKYTGLMRFIGLRELSSAMLIFSQERPLRGVWSRVFGDAMDLGLLFSAFSSRRTKKNRLATTTAVIAGITALDVLTVSQIKRMTSASKNISDFTQEDMDTRTRGGAFQVTRSITINHSAEELYNYWHNFENLPNFMYHLDMVSVRDDRRSHWVAKAPAGQHVEWDAEITQDTPGSLIAWSSIPGSQIPNSGEVTFETTPDGSGTVVRVRIEYKPPAGALGKIVAKMFGEEPGQQVADDLRRFKQVIETGEVLRSDGSPYGSGQKMQRPARPVHDAEMVRDNKGEGKLESQTKRSSQRETARNTMHE